MENNTSFGGAADSLAKQFATVFDAPFPFILIVATVGYGIWKVISHLFEVRLASKSELIALLQAQLQDYKDKLNGASPEAAKARMDALEERIEAKFQAQRPKMLSSDQKDAIALILSPFKGGLIEILADVASVDANSLSKGLVDAFNSAGWHVRSGSIMGLTDVPECGISINIDNPLEPNTPQSAIMNACTSAGLKFALQKRRSDHMGDLVRPVADIVLSFPSGG